MPRSQKVSKKREGKYYPRKNTINSKLSTTDSKLNAHAGHAHDSTQSCAKEKKIPNLNESFSSFDDSVGIINPLTGHLPPEKLFRKRLTLILRFRSKMQQTFFLSPFRTWEVQRGKFYDPVWSL
ncbi:hypothetical protein TNCV_1324931 [Trichonephila clavipes]|nr:hypothetical protein TNCV_1324931 [Trichonephila clavipes]